MWKVTMEAVTMRFFHRQKPMQNRLLGDNATKQKPIAWWRCHQVIDPRILSVLPSPPLAVIIADARQLRPLYRRKCMA